MPGPPQQHPPRPSQPGPPGSTSGRASGRGQWVAAAIATVLVLAVALTVIVALNSGDDPATTTSPTATSTADQTAAEELPAGGILDGAGGSGSEQEAGPAEPADESALREVLPLDFTASSCTATDRPAGDGSLAALTCGASITSPGANASDFFLYDTAEALDAAFEAYVRERSLDGLPSSDGAECGEEEGFGEYTQGGPVLGALACFIDSEDTAYLVWTNAELRVFAITSAASGDAVGLRELYDWWVARGQITPR